ncbi:MAG: DUF350 domain-containing protein [Burkholderiales bacterium]|jgi:putative membrane protein|nr:DUF350 domain-containing protein [Burkholderiales bacterium]MCE1176575.1 DUF350 domain-containing protein [Burkholderiales bacterium]
MSILSTLPGFLAYLFGALACLGLFIMVYIHLTPFSEIKLIRSGNHSAATALVGALLGYALPLSSAIVHSVTLRDMVIWALVGLITQYLAHLCTRLIIPTIKQDIDNNNQAIGTVSAGISVVLGLINAACMVY